MVPRHDCLPDMHDHGGGTLQARCDFLCSRISSMEKGSVQRCIENLSDTKDVLLTPRKSQPCLSGFPHSFIRSITSSGRASIATDPKDEGVVSAVEDLFSTPNMLATTSSVLGYKDGTCIWSFVSVPFTF